MKLGALIEGLSGLEVQGRTDVEITGIALDSRAVEPGFLFAALPGQRADGRAFVADAAERGARAVLGPAGAGTALAPAVSWVGTPAPRPTLARLARRFHGAPDEQLRVIGITGTDGKTTTAHLLAAALAAGGLEIGVGGTLGQRLRGTHRTTALTTPEAPDLWRFLAEAAAGGADGVVLEVSSAAVVADRVEGLRLAAAVLTTLGRDHLDVHGTLAAYHAAKRRLFETLAPEAVAVLPADVPDAAGFAAACPATVITFGENDAADWRVGDHRPDGTGARFRLTGPTFSGEVRTPRPGPWDARNITAAVAAAVALGVSPDAAVAGASGLDRVEGRWQHVDEGQPFAAVVDYAHTPDALERVLEAARAMAGGRVLLVLGCGGGRDRDKREPMGEVAGRRADLVFVTEDNPRDEDPDAIAAAILRGVAASSGAAERVAGRRAAIRRAVAAAAAGDVVLVAGKGHETWQEIGGRREAFDDRDELRAALRARGEGA
jgi:UDP-N-acetylmuramoyl-L-alanyl-D-glutamate--2,6-diaminopimelate ligase